VKPKIVQQTGDALLRAHRVQKRHKYEKNEKNKEIAMIGLQTKVTPITHQKDVRPTVERLLTELNERHVNAIQVGSGFVLCGILSVDLNVAARTPLDARSYIPLPDFLQRKRCIVNVKNDDNRYFGYALLAPLHPEHYHKHSGRAGKCDGYFAQYGLDSINYPVKIEDLESLERQVHIPFNVFAFLDDEGERAQTHLHESHL
jgi:hypothetical protein